LLLQGSYLSHCLLALTVGVESHEGDASVAVDVDLKVHPLVQRQEHRA
jgi:hypothetical protein